MNPRRRAQAARNLIAKTNKPTENRVYFRRGRVKSAKPGVKGQFRGLAKVLAVGGMYLSEYWWKVSARYL